MHTYRINGKPEQSIRNILEELSGRFRLDEPAPEQTTRMFLDSFDWRVARSGHVLECVQHATGFQVEWKDRESGATKLLVDLDRPPRFANDLEPGALRDALTGILDVRALICEARLDSQTRRIALKNKQEKTVVRIEVGTHCVLNHAGEAQQDLGYWLFLKPVRGYPGALERASGVITRNKRVTAARQDLLSAALEKLNIQPLAYCSKPDFALEPNQPAWKGLQTILQANAANMRDNEAGLCADLDPEFLHDFRVAVRRTRSALSDIRDVTNRTSIEPFRREFRWLQQLTGPERDLDVYLIGFDGYRAELSEQAGDELLPFRTFLLEQKKTAHAQVSEGIQSTRYANLMREWEAFLTELGDAADAGPASDTPMLPLASRLISKAYDRVIRDGRRITDSTPAEHLHDLRKQCKRLRYLLEFFTCLYPQREMNTLVKALKGLQENLGNFQDFEVQSLAIDQFSRQMMADNFAPPTTYLAMGQLIERLEEKQHRARREFHARFSAFNTPETTQRVRKLFGKRGAKT